MLNFAYPWLFLMAPLPWLLWVLLPPLARQAGAVRVPFGKRLDEARNAAPAIHKVTTRAPAWLIPAIVWLFVLTALARPQWIGMPIEKNMPTRDLLLLVDLSGSMDKEDFTNAAGQPINRLEAVKEIVGDFLMHREGDRVGLVVFGDAPFLQSPFSTDLELSRQLLDETAVGMAGPRTALGDAIGLGINFFQDSNAPAKTIIALTDGNDTKSQVPPVEAARIATERDIRIHTVAIGDPTTVGEDKLDQETLEEVAQATGGQAYFAGDREKLAAIYAELDRIETREIKTLTARPRDDLLYYPLAAGLLVSMVSKISLRRSLMVVGKKKDDRPLRVHPHTGELELMH